MNRQLVVDSRTLGAPMAYTLAAENLSSSGLLLHVGSSWKTPFQVNTLLEMLVDPQGTVLERPVPCIGRVVRLTTSDGRETQLGVHIVQMEAKDQAAWEKAVVDLGAMGQERVRALPRAGG